MEKDFDSIIKDMLLELGPQSSNAFVRLIVDKTGLSKRNARYRLKKLYRKRTVEWLRRHPTDWNKKADVWYYHIGQEALLERKKEVVIGKVEGKYRNESDKQLQLRILHAKKIQDLVIKSLLDRFKKAKLGWEVDLPRDKQILEDYFKWGIPYFEVYMGGKGLVIPVYSSVKSKVLLEDYLENHAPSLSKMIDEFNEIYQGYWKIYFDIHSEIRDIIYDKTGLPIMQYDMVKFHKFPGNVDHVTTNLQYELANIFSLYDDTYTREDARIRYSVRRQKDMYECYSDRHTPKKFYLRIKCRDIKEEDFLKWIDKIMSEIISDIKKSNKIKNFSKKITSVGTKLWREKHNILNFLEKEMSKELLDGFCDYCVP